MKKTRIMHIEDKIRIAEWTGADWPRHVFRKQANPSTMEGAPSKA
jgi:hypothetical protein